VASGRIATLQTMGSSGGLKVGADFIKRWFPDSQVWVSDPTWDNHRAMFEGAGLTVNTYPYYDAATGGLRFDAMLDTLRTLPARSVVLLHACCHNPTGVDLSPAQWDALIPVLRERQLLPYLDLAYQGYGDGIEQDAFAVRAAGRAGLTFFVANSFSKSMSVYGERCRRAERGVRRRRRGRAGAGPAEGHGAAQLLQPGHPCRRHHQPRADRPRAARRWEADVAAMRERILAMRRSLHGVLSAKLPGRDLGYFLSQRGMFSYTGLSAAQVDRLREEFGVYLIRSGRMCVAGLNTGNVERTACAAWPRK
jgi:aromatic-amino-acid transaminase